jgi:hypothetical protein
MRGFVTTDEMCWDMLTIYGDFFLAQGLDIIIDSMLA